MKCAGLPIIWQVSIHASAREATTWVSLEPSFSAVSIHASAREATRFFQLGILGFEFQSTPPRGRRLQVVLLALVCIAFQSTPPRGRRHFKHIAQQGAQ